MTVTVVSKLDGVRPLDGKYAYPLSGPTLEGQALAIAAKYGASVYLPGRDNFSDSALTSAAVNDGSVGGVKDGKSSNSFPATQSTAGFKPTLIGGARNLLTYSEDFSNVAWVFNNTVRNGVASPAPNGTNTSLSVSSDASNTPHFINGATVTSVVGLSYTQSVYLKAGTTNRVQITFSSSLFGAGQYANFSLVGAGSVLASAGGTASITTTDSVWYRCSFSAVATAAATGTMAVVGFISSDTATRLPTYTGNATDQLFVWGFQTEIGSTASPYVPTTSAPASSGGNPKAWLLDGLDDRLSLSGLLFQMADDHFVVACAKPLTSTGSLAVFGEAGASVQRCGVVYLNGGFFRHRFADDAGVPAEAVSSQVTSVGEVVVVAATKQTNTSRILINGVVRGTISTAALGVTTLTQANIGAISAGSAPFNGSIYGVIAGKGTITDAELLVLEKYLASRGGITI